jgi:DNA-binding MarR family transcriptional regulator
MAFENIENFNPKSCIFGKISRINRLSNTIIRKHLSPFNITESQTSILFVFSKRKNLTQKQLAEFTKLEKSSVNRNIKRLIENGSLTKKEFPQLKITKKGLKIVSEIIPEWEKAMEEINSLLSSKDINSIDIIHNKLN